MVDPAAYVKAGLFVSVANEPHWTCFYFILEGDSILGKFSAQSSSGYVCSVFMCQNASLVPGCGKAGRQYKKKTGGWDIRSMSTASRLHVRITLQQPLTGELFETNEFTQKQPGEQQEKKNTTCYLVCLSLWKQDTKS